MPTQNRRIATYLPKEVDEKFKAFKLERGIKGDSNALLTVLSEFLGLTNLAASLVPAQNQELSQQLDDLKAELALLEGRLFSRLKSELLIEVSKISVPLISDAVSESVQMLGRSDEFDSDDLTCLAGKDLSLRLNIRSDAANRWRPGKDRAKSPEDLLKATRKKDPDGIGWFYLPEIDKFQSEKPLPGQLPIHLQTELPTLPLFDPDEHF